MDIIFSVFILQSEMIALLILGMSAQIKQKTSHIEFEVYFPPQLNLENAKNSLDVEGPHHYNMFF